jgi:(p)ppGpp synthase/HD superfamily hydrolase
MLIGRAMQIALRAHHGQIDRDGLPHIFHCMRVAMKQKNPKAFIIAILHDVIEDGGVGSMLSEEGLSCGVYPALDLLTRQQGESYEDYIRRIIRSGDFDAMEVKRADIEDNTRVERMDMKAAAKFPLYKAAHMALCEALGIQSDLSVSCQE